MFDRFAAQIDARPADHVLGLKVCSGALCATTGACACTHRCKGEPLDLDTSVDALAKVALRTPAAGAGDALPKTTFHAVATPLERALKVGEQSGALAVTRGEHLRTLGGADDLRSPRAPGMIDKIGKTAGPFR